MRIVSVIDGGTGKPVGELAQVKIYSISLQISCDSKNYRDLEELDIDEIYALMKDGKMLSTSLPSLGKIEELFQGLKQQGYDMIFAVPVYNGLGGIINAMGMIARQQGITSDCVDCHVVAAVQEYMIKPAKQLYEVGKSIEQIKEVSQHTVHTANAILLPSDLQRLKRGGRLTPLAATLDGLLKIKPILKISEETNGKIDILGKVRMIHRAMDRVIEIMKCEHVDDSYLIIVAHADDETETLVYMDKLKQASLNAMHQIIKLVSAVGIHIGRDYQAVQYFKQIKG